MKKTYKYILIVLLLAVVLLIPNKVNAEGSCIDNYGSIVIEKNAGDNNIGGNINYYETKNNNTWSENSVTFKVQVQAPSGDKVQKIRYKISSYEDCTGTIEGDDISSNTGSVTLAVTINNGYVESMTFSGTGIERNGSGKLSSISGEKISVKKEGTAGETDKNSEFGDLTPKQGNCEGRKELLALLDDYWKWVVILVPALLIIMGTVDFLKAMASDDQDAIKKNSSNFIKRTIATIAVILLPTLLKMLFSIFGLSDVVCL